MTHEQGAFGLEPHEFGTVPELPWEEKSKFLRGPKGILLDGPTDARVDEQRTIPYLGAWVAPADLATLYGFHAKALLATTRVEDGSSFVAWVSEGPKSEEPIPPLPPADAPPNLRSGTSLELFQFDLCNSVDIGWRAGTYRTWVLMHDVRSNPVTTQVLGQKIVDPAVEAFLATKRSPAYAPPVSPSPGEEFYPSYQEDDGSPAIPEEDGVALAIERVTLGEHGGSLILRGSFRLPLLARQLVRPLVEGEEPPTTPPTAVVPIGLFAIGNEQSDPRQLRMQVPTWDEVDPDALDQARVTGHFNVDLRRHLDLPCQTYALWALAAGELWGPTYAALVDPAMVPKPGE
jgi:hypothetical protein